METLALACGFVAVLLLFTVSTTTSLVLMLHAWRTPEVLAATRFPRFGAAAHSFSLLVPARHEHTVLRRTLTRLAGNNHPDVQIVVIVGDDDEETEWVARKVAEEHPGRIDIVIDAGRRKSKPSALNVGLAACRGEIVGVFDAEDQVHPDLLERVDACFERTGAAVVQGGVQLMNIHSNWFSARNALEYWFWYRSRLHFHAQQDYIPLGGNTVFVRAAVLRAHGGWDESCLAEDCDLGTRLSTRGERIVVAYDAALATREEVPHALSALVRQRTRWDQGFLQVLRKGDWRRLPPQRRAIALYTLTQPFVQALGGVTFPLLVLGVVALRLPIVYALLSFLPLVPMLTLLAVECAALGDLGREFGIKLRLRDYARLVIGALPYQLVLAVAAVRATLREAFGVGHWEKTDHAGAHL